MFSRRNLILRNKRERLQFYFNCIAATLLSFMSLIVAASAVYVSYKQYTTAEKALEQEYEKNRPIFRIKNSIVGENYINTEFEIFSPSTKPAINSLSFYKFAEFDVENGKKCLILFVDNDLMEKIIFAVANRVGVEFFMPRFERRTMRAIIANMYSPIGRLSGKSKLSEGRMNSILEKRIKEEIIKRDEILELNYKNYVIFRHIDFDGRDRVSTYSIESGNNLAQISEDEFQEIMQNVTFRRVRIFNYENGDMFGTEFDNCVKRDEAN